MIKPATLILIGYWSSDQEPQWPDPTDLVDRDWDEDERFAVHGYLRHGLLARAYLGPSQCRICGEHVGNEELTDGIYIWPEGLAHYIRNHHVRLPAEFVEHVKRRDAERDAIVVGTDWWQSKAGGGRP